MRGVRHGEDGDDGFEGWDGKPSQPTIPSVLLFLSTTHDAVHPLTEG